jgi:hypothetical protein
MTKQSNKLFKNLPGISRFLNISVNTFRNRYLNPLLEMERKTGIKSGIIKTGSAKRASYIFLTDNLIKAMQLLNKEDLWQRQSYPKGLKKETKPTTLTSYMGEQDIEKQLEQLLNLKL